MGEHSLGSPVVIWARGDNQWVQAFRSRLKPMVMSTHQVWKGTEPTNTFCRLRRLLLPVMPSSVVCFLRHTQQFRNTAVVFSCAATCENIVSMTSKNNAELALLALERLYTLMRLAWWFALGFLMVAVLDFVNSFMTDNPGCVELSERSFVLGQLPVVLKQGIGLPR